MKKKLLILLILLSFSCAATADSQVESFESLLQQESVSPDPQVIENIIIENTVIEDYKPGGKTVVGEKEKIFLAPPGEYFDSRIDTGAATSSIHAADIQWFERDGRTWVRFNMNHDGVDRVIEKQVEGIRSIRQTGSSAVIDRPVVKIYSQIGDVELDVEYTLADRSHMTFPVLIGRNFLQDHMVVDVSHEYLHKERDR